MKTDKKMTLWLRRTMAIINNSRRLQIFRATALRVMVLVVSFAVALPLFVAAPVLAVAGTPYLYRGETLTQGQSLVSSNQQNWVIMQGDGNLVIYAEGNPVAPWSTNTAGHPGAYAVMQSDGNFVVYAPSGQALWQSHTYGPNPGGYVSMNGDGNLVIYSYPPLGPPQPLWWTGTTSTWHVGPVRQITETFHTKVTAVVQARFQWNYHNVYIWGSPSCTVSGNNPLLAVGTITWCGTAGNGSNQYMNAGMNVYFVDAWGGTSNRWDRINTDIYGNYWNATGGN